MKKAEERAWAMIIDELSRAEHKHPGWPNDMVHGAAIVAEESGSLVKAALDYFYKRGIKSVMDIEAAQVGAMAIRFLINSLAVKDEKS